MNPIPKAVNWFSGRARQKRATVFRNSFSLDANTKILDLGSENGSHIHSVLNGTKVDPKNVYIADICSEAVNEGNKLYGYNAATINEGEPLPFPDRFFDILSCSSVIEHITVPKDQVWSLSSGSEFKRRSLHRQQQFAKEIKRLGRQYFVQTPNKYFPIESHTWLPIVAYIPRPILLPILRLTNRIGVKKTNPDWYLLNENEFSNLFQNSNVLKEKVLGLTKSLIAMKNHY